MVAPLRRLFVTLLGVAVCTPAFAGVTCTPNDDGSWTCSGDGYEDYPPGTVITNVVGVCTNCVSMSPNDCERLVNELRIAADDIISRSDEVKEVLMSSFMDLSYCNSYLSYFSDDGSAYFDVADDLKSVESTLLDLQTSLGFVSRLDPIWTVIDSINCSSCSASFGGPSSSTTPTNSPSGGCTDCPCKEQMEALKSLLQDDFLPRVKKIDSNVAQLTNLITIARDQLKVTKEGFHNVTNLFNRLDDYVLDDFSNKVYEIRIDVNYIASNLAQKVQRIFIDQSYSNAQFYVRQDSDTPVEMADLDETLIPEGDMSKFDWGEFENLSWFTRVEYLLLKLNGVYVTTNNNANAGVSKAKENQQKIESDFADFKSSVNEDIKTGFQDVGTSITSFFRSFNSAVSTHGDKVVEIQLMSNFIGQEPLMLNIDPDVADACRTISSLLWTVLFGFLLYKIMIYFWVVFVDTINWWVNQTQGFVK